MPFSDEELLDFAREAADEAEVYAVTSEETPVTFEANRLKGILTRQSRSIALRIIKDGRIGFAVAAGPEHAQELVDIALETSRFGAKASFHFMPADSYPVVTVYDDAVNAVSLDQMVQAGQSAIDMVVSHSPSVLCEAVLVKRVSKVHILNSAGTAAAGSKTVFSARIEGALVRDTEMLFVGDALASCHPELDLSSLAQETIRQLELAKTTAKAPSGEFPVVFTPRGFAQAFVAPLAAAFNGKTVLQGASPLGHLLGQQSFDPRLTLIDDPTVPFCPGSRAFDDEGVRAGPLALVERGVVRNFLYDLQAAGLASVVSSGNAARAIGGLPAPGISVFTMLPGDATFDEMVADISEGLVVDELMGSMQGNVLGGDFGGNVLLGYKIENGRIVGRVKDTMVAGNVYKLLKEARAVGSEPRWVHGHGGTLFLPPIACHGVSVSSKV